MLKPWTYQKDEVTGRYFVTSNKTPPFGADVCYGIADEKTAKWITFTPYLLVMLKTAYECDIFDKELVFYDDLKQVLKQTGMIK